ncbi:MAG: HAMP domain-containing histidine kinase [Clostridiales bacterium]|nr:HAMP domain-containing histidine kinase [Clostridiales bacterium]
MKWRENMAMKALAFMAAVAAFTATAIMGWYQLANYDALWDDASESLGYTSYYWLSQDQSTVKYLVRLYERRDSGAELSMWEKGEIEQLEERFAPQNSNLRWQLLRGDGTVVYGNVKEDGAGARSSLYWYEYTLGGANRPNVDIRWEYWDDTTREAALNWEERDGECYNDLWREKLPELVGMARNEEAPEDGSTQMLRVVADFESMAVSIDTALMDDSGYTCVLRVEAPEGLYIYAPTVGACLEPNQFGYIFDPVNLEWVKDASAEAAEAAETAALTLWVDKKFPADDQYRAAAMKLEQWHSSRTEYLVLTIVCGVAGVLLMVYLCCGAGHKRGVEGICLNWFHRLPGDVLLGLMFLGGVGAMGLGAVAVHDAYMDAPMFIQLFCIGSAVGVTAALGMGALITVCARCKAHTLLRNTWIWAICAWCWRVFLLCLGWFWELAGTAGRAVRAVPLVWKAVMGCMAYTLFTIVTMERGAGLWLLVTFLVSVYLCGWAYQWKKIRRGTQEIIGGNPNYHIDTRRMLPDLRGHADELNNLGHAISAAVDDRLKSEHFKAELITNVSHDLKTPLTSIINYVDLLKKEDIQNPKAAEYIEVLDRKSQRLKKLTEDLVEASKASTGNLSVNWERLDWAQLTDQALAETGERLEAQKLTVVRSLPEEPLWVEADGRHLWRVLDNLLTNCAKYALPGTRVYVDLRRGGDWAVLSVKNISRDALDIPAERLMERFVRGDESRNQAGSGLGLSIAQSLTELQHGKFDIIIDGDLFKAVVTLPLAGDRPQDPIQLIL